jgi:CrcB protein
MTILAIAAGGALGSVSRYLIAVRLYGWLGLALPYGTLTVNILGSFLLGVTLALVEERGALGPETRSFITIGFLGGMTTFSTFVFEGWNYTRDGEILRAGLYAALSLAGAFVAFTLGHALVRVLER